MSGPFCIAFCRFHRLFHFLRIFSCDRVMRVQYMVGRVFAFAYHLWGPSWQQQPPKTTKQGKYWKAPNLTYEHEWEIIKTIGALAVEANQASPVNFSFYFQASALALALSTGVRARVGELVRKRKEENHWHPLLQSSAYTCICVCLYVAFFKRLTTQNIVFLLTNKKIVNQKWSFWLWHFLFLWRPLSSEMLRFGLQD